MGYKIDKIGPVTIMEPKVKTKIKFLQKIFIKLFGYKEVCTFTGGGLIEEATEDKVIMKIPVGKVREVTFTAENCKWNEDFIEEIRKEQEEK